MTIDRKSSMRAHIASRRAMQNQLFTMMLLMTLAQDRGEERRLPEPPARPPVFTIGVGRNGTGKAGTVTLTLPEAPQPGDAGDDRQPVRPLLRFDLSTAVLETENFDRWLFGNAGSAKKWQWRLEEILLAKVEDATLLRKLTDAQTAKLRLAGKGDIKRLFDEIEDRRREFERDRLSFGAGLEALRRLEPIAQTYREGLFGKGSLFAKTLNGINANQ